MRKRLTIAISVILLTQILASCSPTNKTNDLAINVNPQTTQDNQQTQIIKIGDYMKLGKYYNEPILWRCVDIDENGPLMLSDKIITIKPLDAKGKHKYIDGTLQTDTDDYRTKFGSNLWETSNLRCWLNSNAIGGNVTWLDGCPPTADKLKYNSYDKEKGFLAEGNFTLSEQNIIKSVTQKSILNSVDVGKLSVGGTAIHKFDDSNITTVVQNYDTAYYHNVVDKVFLLDVKQLLRVHQNKSILGVDYYIGKPTRKAVDNSEYKTSELSVDNNWDTLTRTPFTEANDTIGTRGVRFDGTVISYSSINNYPGIRPAFYLNVNSLSFKSGTGQIAAPFQVE